MRPAQAESSKTPHLVPSSTLPGGELAAEVNCYVNVNPNGSWLVCAHVAIPPSSQQAVEHLHSQDLCMDERLERRLVVRRSRSWLLQANARLGRSPRG
jgi:hypothetical protein